MTQVRQKLIVANWKMNGAFDMAHSLLEEVLNGTQHFKSPSIVICPPFVYLQHVAQLIESNSSVSLGAQNCSEHSAGAYTGEVSSNMLKDVGCKYVICGHSERRQYNDETDEDVAQKAISIIDRRLTPIVCVGETLNERQSGKTDLVIERQIDSILEHCGKQLVDRITVAYEPIWAIGTGRSATPAQAQEVHQLIRNRIATLSQSAADGCRILYGGSVTGENAAEVLDQNDVDGCLVGGASLKAAQFIEICRAAQR